MKRILHYLDEIAAQFQTGLATEHSYRAALQSLLEALLPSVTVVNEPAHIACGAPDFLLRSKGATQAPVGYIETKDLGDPDLDGNKANKEQFDRYKSHLFNVAFTDYLDFRFYEDGEFKAAIRIAEIRDGKIVPASAERLEDFVALVEHFGAAHPKAISSPARLAKLMAGKARLLARAIRETIAADTEGFGPIRQQMQTIRAFLIHDLSEDAFADIYAQTITYGMFAARLHDPRPETFSREEAAQLIPKTNPLMRKIFLDIAQDLDESLSWIVDDLVALFAAADVAALMQGYGKERGEADPVLHFYEDFLTEYNPKLRRQRGVWYTPTPVVRFIVRAVDRILAQDFGLPGGLADKSQIKVKAAGDAPAGKKGKPVVEREMHRVQILDPAAGTGAFLAETVSCIREKFAAMQGLWPDYARQHLLPRLNGFEILMASYALAHLKLDMLLTESGCTLGTKQRLRVFLTNSLEDPPIIDTRYMWAAALEQEVREAKTLKNDCPVMVVLGNPPYSGESQNKGKAIMHLMEDYKKEPGGKEKLKERNPKWINDDYVKFIRLAQHYIDRTGEGIIGFINPHGFLDNPTFRGMRWKLLESFDEIYILNLHGNAKKKESAPDGSKDENVFDIMQGVCINFFVKRKEEDAARSCIVRYADLYGKREDKYDFLESSGLEDIKWQEVTPVAPMFFFVPKDTAGEEEYNRGFSVNELFLNKSVSIVTANDKTLVARDKETLKEQVEQGFGIAAEIEKITKYAYRPFDTRFVYYDVTKIERPREKLMYHLLSGDNVAILVCRQLAGDEWYHTFVSDNIIDDNYVSNKTRERGYVFPLYIYNTVGKQEKTPNLNPEITARIAEAADGEVAPEDIFHYIYAVLHTPEYREKYKAFLKVDFPRIPYPADGASFRRFAELGRQLVETHLLRNPKTQDMFNPLAQFPVTGTNRVESLRFDAGKVYINPVQYFDNVPKTAWNFFIGGYQPAQKWLKDRKGRALSSDDILHYKAIIIALTETARLMAELSALVSETDAAQER